MVLPYCSIRWLKIDDSMDSTQKLAETSVPRLLFAFSIPAVIGMLAQALYNVVDRVFVGQAVGTLGIAGITVCFPIMLVFTAFCLLVGQGAASVISIRLGQNDRERAEEVLHNAALLLVVVAVLLAAIVLPAMDSILRFFGSSDDVLPYARDYLQIITFGTVFQALGFGLNAVVRGEGNVRAATWTVLIAAGLNVALDSLLILGLGWGMRGAALATVTAQGAAAWMVLRYFRRGRGVLKLRLGRLRWQGSVLKSIIVFGAPTFAMAIASSCCRILMP